MNQLADTLMELKRRAELSGRPISQREAAGAAQGYFSDQANRNFQGKQLALQEQGLNLQSQQFADQLAQRKAEYQAQLAAASKARTQGWWNTGAGAGLAGSMLYYM